MVQGICFWVESTSAVSSDVEKRMYEGFRGWIEERVEAGGTMEEEGQGVGGGHLDWYIFFHSQSELPSDLVGVHAMACCLLHRWSSRDQPVHIFL